MLKESSELVIRLSPGTEQRPLEHRFDLEGEGVAYSVFPELEPDSDSLCLAASCLIFSISARFCWKRSDSLYSSDQGLLPTRFMEASSNRIEHVLCHVDVVGALSSTIGKVLDNVLSVWTDVAKVHRFPASLEQQQAIEVLKEKRIGWWMVQRMA